MQARFEATRRGGPTRFLLRHGLVLGTAFAVMVTCSAELVRGSHLVASPVVSFLLRFAIMLVYGLGFGVALAVLSWRMWYDGQGRAQ